MPATIKPAIENCLESRPLALHNASTRAAMEEAESGKLPQFGSMQELFADLVKNSLG